MMKMVCVTSQYVHLKTFHLQPIYLSNCKYRTGSVLSSFMVKITNLTISVKYIFHLKLPLTFILSPEGRG